MCIKSKAMRIVAVFISAIMACFMCASVAAADSYYEDDYFDELYGEDEGIFLPIGKTSFTLSVGDTDYVQYDDSNYNWDYRFESTNKEVVTVNDEGKFKAISLGTAAIEALNDDTDEVLAKWTVSVTKKSLTVKTITGTKWNFGTSLANVKGWKSGSYKSSNKKICSVKGSTLTTHKSGNVSITAKIKGITYTLKVKVVAVPSSTAKAKTESYVKKRLYYPSSYQRISLTTNSNGVVILKYSAFNAYGTRVANIAYGYYSGTKLYVDVN